MKIPKFKINGWKRLIILATTLVVAILSIILGTYFYTSKNINKSIEYGGGTEYVVKVDDKSNSDISVDNVAQEIYERIDKLGIKGVKITTENRGTDHFIRVNYSGIKDKEEILNIKNSIIHKPHLIFTDLNSKPLFNEFGDFIDPTSHPFATTNWENFEWVKQSKPPIVANSAKVINNNGDFEVHVQIEQNHIIDWVKATMYVSQLKNDENKILSWFDLDDWVNEIKNVSTATSTVWEESKNNPYNALFMQSDPKKPMRVGSFGKYLINNANDYLISSTQITTFQNSIDFVISKGVTASRANELAKKINFGFAQYDLKSELISSKEPTYGSSAFQKVMLVGIIAFSIIAILLIVNYGLLGALSTISIALFMFITLTLFTIMRGEYSPEAFAAIIIGIGIAIDANIITFERLKNEIYNGHNLQKANKLANKKSFWSIFDANIAVLIVAIALFYFGLRSTAGISIILMLSILFTLIIILGFTRFTSTMLIRSGYFDKRLKLLGVIPKIDKKITEKLTKINFMGISKYFISLSSLILLAGIIVMIVMAILAGNISGGFVLSNDFKEGTIYQFVIGKNNTLNDINTILVDNGLNNLEKTISNNVVTVFSESKNISSAMVNLLKNPIWEGNYYFSNTSSSMINFFIRDAMIAISIAIGLLSIYVLIRFKWVFAISAIISLIHNGLIITALFVLARFEISPIFVVGILAIFGFSINDTIVTFDKIREKITFKKYILSKNDVKSIANEAIQDTLKRSIITLFLTMIIAIVLISFGNKAIKWEFSALILIGLFFSSYSSIFIATYLWTLFENRRQKSIEKRIKNNFWKTNDVEEQTIANINDFKY